MEESGGFMERIGKFGPCVSWHVPHLISRPVHHHIPQCIQDRFTGKFFAEFLLKKTVNVQRNVTGKEVGPDPDCAWEQVGHTA